MKRSFLTLCLSVLMLLGWTWTTRAIAAPTAWHPVYLAETTTAASPSTSAVTFVETQVLPKLESVLTPEQLEQFKTDMGSGQPFRTAFKALSLTPAQKADLKTLFKSATDPDAFAALTPEEKKQLFLKKKAMFMPTSEEITDRITAGMKVKGVTLPEGVQDKINAGMKMKEVFMSPEGIAEKIKAKAALKEMAPE